jgi:hypothetical protein
MMNQNIIFYPLLIQIMLVLLLYILLGIEKSKAVKAGTVDRKKTALHNNAWPDHVLRVSNNIANQFETPILFFVLSLVFFSLKAVDVTVLVLSCVYVASRIVHAYIHVTSNYVPKRLGVFMVGCVILIVLVVLAMKGLMLG